jgi:hypothetical protein
MKDNYNKEIRKLVKRVFCYPEFTYEAVPYKGALLNEIVNLPDVEDEFDVGLVQYLKSYKVKESLVELDDQMNVYKDMKNEHEEDEWCDVYSVLTYNFFDHAVEEMKELIK